MKPSSSTSIVILTSVLLLFLLMGWITYVVLLSIPHIASLRPLSDLQGLGQLGDFIGGTLNPAIGAMTVIGLAITIYYQREQLVDAKETNSQLLRLTLESNKTSISGAKLAAIVHVLEDRVKRADSAMKQHSIVVDAKKKNEAQHGGPFDTHFFNQWARLTADVEFYNEELINLLQDLGGPRPPNEGHIAEMNRQLNEKLHTKAT